ncbi:MAG TPA: hypothetical protein VND91_02555 [Candidatus Saccharimonadia bacterium]|nr:hypothetical protein [Candidatus Saccharimonadia bacterium]
MTRQESAARIADLLLALRAARDPEREPRNTLAILPELRRWQSERLEHGFSDLTRRPNYRAASRFFLDDLYGEQDVSWRDRDISRMLPTLRSWLPESVLQTVVKALELDQLSHELDLSTAAAFAEHEPPGTRVDDATYAAAYRRGGTRRQRERQIELLLHVGKELERIVRKPMVFAMLKFARAPARAAGLGKLQGFLERGFSAFREMGSADDFLEAIEDRELELLRRLFAGHPAPFDVNATTAEVGSRRRSTRRQA